MDSGTSLSLFTPGRGVVLAALILLVAAMASGVATAQELSPRALWPMPNGTNVLVVGYQRTTGDIVTDPSLPITGVDSTIDFLQFSYQRGFGLLGRSANVQLSLPYSEGRTEGTVDGVFLTRDTSGFTDARARFSINLIGAPSMDTAGFRALVADPGLIIGASLIVQPPTGEYESDKVINLGTNRWAAKPAVGLIWPMRPSWLLEFEVGIWLFGDNDDFLGQTREQDPLLSSEVHLVKQIRPGFWVSLDANYYEGGQTHIGDLSQANFQRNSRAGLTAYFAVKGRHAIRSSFSSGTVTESGGDYDIFTLSYLYVW
jgi:Putative MetA-pathway of phenol degradation